MSKHRIEEEEFGKAADGGYQKQRDFFPSVTGDSQNSDFREALPREAETMLSHPSITV